MLRWLRLVTLSGLAGPSIAGSQAVDPNAAAVSIMFRGTPAHTGVAAGRLFGGQGGVRWRFQTRSAVRSTPAVTTTRVFVGSGDSTLYALDRSNGTPVWTFAAGGPVHSSPAVSHGLVIAATLGGRIFAVSEASGALRWSVQTGPTLPPNITPAGEWDLYVSSPVVVDRTIVIGAGDGNVYAFDLTTGKERWRLKTGGRVRATPSVKDGVAVVGSWDGRVYAIDMAGGRTRWVHRTVGDTLDLKREGYDRRAIQSTAAIAEGNVFLGSRDDGFYALDFATGEQKWRSSHHTSWVVGSPAVRDGRAYVGSSDGHFIHSVEVASGRELWRTPVGSNVLSSPVLTGDLLVVGIANTNAGRGELLALDASSGVVRWRLPFGDACGRRPSWPATRSISAATTGVSSPSRKRTRRFRDWRSTMTPRPVAGRSLVAAGSPSSTSGVSGTSRSTPIRSLAFSRRGSRTVCQAWSSSRRMCCLTWQLRPHPTPCCSVGI
jgi:outer membrane protein assembly factor BamB